MIHEIVLSDVELARGMVDSGHPDAEILACLASRGLEPAKAAQLVDDLRHGRKPSAQLPFELRQASPSAVGRRETARGEAPPAQHSHRRRSGSGKHERSGISWWFIILGGIVLWALGYVLFGTGTNVSQDAVDQLKHEIPPPPGKEPAQR